MKQLIKYWPVLAIMAALIAGCWFWPPKGGVPVPTFQVSQDTIIIFPDLTLGADRVEISITDQAGEKFLTESFVPDSLSDGLVFEVPASLKGTRWKVKVRQAYLKKSKRIPCGTNETELQPGTGGGTGTPIIGMDVVVNRNTLPQPNAGSYTNACSCNWVLMTPGPINTTHPYVRELVLPAYSGSAEERFKIVVTNTAGGGGTSTFLLSWLNATTVQYHTHSNFTGCSLSNEAAFSANGKVISYTTSTVDYSFRVLDLPAGGRSILFFAYPAPGGATPPGTGYTIQVYNTNASTCPTVTL